MNRLKRLLAVAAFMLCATHTQAAERGERENFNKDWQFTLADSGDYGLETFQPEDWRTLNLPHDWSVEHPFSEDLNGCVGYLPGGIGWYFKEFVTTSERDQKFFILFDGIYNNAEVRVNGRVVGTQYYGYSPFYYDLSKYLNPKGQKNTLAIRVDRSRVADCRWYPGSGIYRDVEVMTTEKLYIPIWGAFIKTLTASASSADISIDVDVVNEHETAQSGSVVTRYFNPMGELVKVVTTPFTVGAESEIKVRRWLRSRIPDFGILKTPIYTLHRVRS